jgi:uncharacterized protein (TIGR04255 family)
VNRPPDLPEFENPPVTEVVLGIQFDTPMGYQQIMAGDVWKLFATEFPQVQEQLPLPPVFETFGPQASSLLSFRPIMGPSHIRFWFVSKTGDEIIQFQNDRLLHNWRKITDQPNEYPRFDKIAVKFLEEATCLEGFFKNLSSQPLRITQCELSYYNCILPENRPISEWLRFLSFATDPDDFTASFRTTISGAGGAPKGRLSCESATAVRPDGLHFVTLNLTARGIPDQPSLESALEFLKHGRDMIVRTFTDITTDTAHKAWGRTA